MVRRITLALLLAAAGARGAVDFTPIPLFVQYEGARVEQPSFRNGDAVVTFEPPPGWAMEGAGPVLSLSPRDVQYVLARVETRPLPRTALDAEETLKAVREKFAAQLPREAGELKWEPAIERNPVLLNKHESVRLEATYAVNGQGFCAWVMICQVADQQLVFTVSSRERDFAKVSEAWRRSWFTWQGWK